MRRFRNQQLVAGMMNHYGSERIPFYFVLDFEFQKMMVFPKREKPDWIDFTFGQESSPKIFPSKPLNFQFSPIDFDLYKSAFEYCQTEINKGNSYLLNLSFRSKVDSNWSLKELYYSARAKYKIHIQDECLSFSPETFVKINAGVISTFPMKGTILANSQNAAEILKNDPKEHAEHATIVDLLRNDLSIVSKKVRVEKFKYLERIESNNGSLLQMSSKISGQLPDNYQNQIGDIIFKLLPAGSISGAPKKKTIEIINATESDERGYYTGVFGYFDGVNLDSAVMIRFMEKQNNQLYYRSGGGITAQSELHKEYQELIDKIYVPIIGNNTIGKRQNALTQVSQ